MFLVVRGPAPSCRVAGVIPVRGRKGENTVYFAGRVHGRQARARRLPDLALTEPAPAPGAATEYVRVVSPAARSRSRIGREEPTCTNVTSVAMAAASRA